MLTSDSVVNPKFFGVGWVGFETTPNFSGWGGLVLKPPQFLWGGVGWFENHPEFKGGWYLGARKWRGGTEVGWLGWGDFQPCFRRWLRYQRTSRESTDAFANWKTSTDVAFSNRPSRRQEVICNLVSPFDACKVAAQELRFEFRRQKASLGQIEEFHQAVLDVFRELRDIRRECKRGLRTSHSRNRLFSEETVNYDCSRAFLNYFTIPFHKIIFSDDFRICDSDFHSETLFWKSKINFNVSPLLSDILTEKCKIKTPSPPPSSIPSQTFRQTRGTCASAATLSWTPVYGASVFCAARASFSTQMTKNVNFYEIGYLASAKCLQKTDWRTGFFSCALNLDRFLWTGFFQSCYSDRKVEQD